MQLSRSAIALPERFYGEEKRIFSHFLTAT